MIYRRSTEMISDVNTRSKDELNYLLNGRVEDSPEVHMHISVEASGD